jgi:hypothetical protein
MRTSVLAAFFVLVVQPARGDQRLIVEGHEDYPRCSRAADAIVEELARSAKLRRVRALAVAASAKGMKALAASRYLSGLRTLSICTDDAGVAALAASPYVSSVTELSIFSEEQLRPETITRLVTSRHLRKLRVLRFIAGDSEAEHTIGPDGLQALVQHMALPGLKELDLRWNPLDETSVIALLAADFVEKLERLDLCHTAFSDAVADLLIARKRQLPHMNHVCISYGIVGGPSEPLDRIRAAYGAVAETD